MKNIFKEPFFHFISIGIALFLLYSNVTNETNSKNTILIDNSDIANILANWEMTWKRPPTEEELKGLLNQNLKQEVFYLEALRMNLDHNDEIIKRRLSQKMQFLAKNIANITAPSEESLRKYYQEHRKKYLAPQSYSLYQIIFSPDKRKNYYEDALKTRNQNPNASFKEMENKGDALPFAYFQKNKSDKQLAMQFGNEFPKNIKDKELNKWIGPIASSFGFHLVYITEEKAPYLPEFELKRKEVERDFKYENQKKTDEEVYRALKKNYTIELDIQSDTFTPEFTKTLEKELNN